VFADFFGCVDEVELDRPTATRLEVYEQQPVLRGEQVARVRLTVQQLLGAAALADRSSQARQRGGEELPVGGGEGRGVVVARDQTLSLLDPIREVRRGDIEPAQAGVQPPECVRVVGRWDLPT
jgi:hypothetical protein